MTLVIWVTDMCNLSCTYCYEGNNKTNYMMNETTADLIVEEYIKKQMLIEEAITVEFHGGEPLINYSIIKYIFEKIVREVPNYKEKVRFGLTTNGTIMNDEIIDFLCNHCNYNLSISIDGNEITHNKNRIDKNGVYSFDKVKENSIKLLSKRSDVRARMTVVPETIGNLYDNVVFLHSIGFRTIVPSIDMFNVNWNKEYLEILLEMSYKIIDFIREKQLLGMELSVGIIYDAVYSHKKSACNVSCKNINIDANGDLYPCTFTVGKTEFIIGNIRDGIKSSTVDYYNDEFLKKNKECDDCTNYDYCLGSKCKFINKLITGNYHMPPGIICSLEKIKIKTADYYKLMNVEDL